MTGLRVTFAAVALLSLFALAGCAQAPQLARADVAVETGVEVERPSLPIAPYTAGEEWWAHHQKPLGDAAFVAQEAYPDDFAYGYFTGIGSSRFVIGFRASAPADVVAAFEATGLPFTVEENVGYTDAEAYSVAESVVPLLAPPTDDDAGIRIGAAPDRGPGVIRVVVTTEDGSRPGWVADRLEQVSVPAGFSVVIDYEQGEPITAEAFDGPTDLPGSSD